MPEFTSQTMTKSQLASAWADWAKHPCCGTVILAGSKAGQTMIWAYPETLPTWTELASEGAFVWEALLYAPKQFSISVRHADGQWRVNQANWEGTAPEQALKAVGLAYHSTQTLALNIPAERPMQWIEAWEPRPDRECADFPVLTPTHLAFIGFAL
jgi:CRISPR type III-associated protein (TIGR04423 family)